MPVKSLRKNTRGLGIKETIKGFMLNPKYYVWKLHQVCKGTKTDNRKRHGITIHYSHANTACYSGKKNLGYGDKTLAARVRRRYYGELYPGLSPTRWTRRSQMCWSIECLKKFGCCRYATKPRKIINNQLRRGNI